MPERERGGPVSPSGHLEPLLESAHVGTFEWDAKTDCVLWSPVHERLWGYAPGEFGGTIAEVQARVHPDDAPQLADALEHSRATGAPFRREFRVVWPDGSLHWILGSGAFDYEADEAVRMRGVAIEITEWRVAEAALRQSEAARRDFSTRLDLLAAHVPGILYQFSLRPDGSSCFPYSSVGMLSVYGVRPEEVVEDASPVFAVLHPEDLPRIAESIAASARTLATWHESYRVNLPEGRTIWVEGESSPQRLADGSTLWHGYIRDITERKRADEALAASERRLRLMLDTLPLAAFLSSDGHTKMEYVNSTYTRMFGYTLADVPTVEAWMQRAYPDPAYRATQLAETRREAARAEADPTHVVMRESRVTCADGSVKDVLWRYVRLPELDLAFGYGQDVTADRRAEEERARLSEQLRESQKLEAIGSLAGGVAHDFNNHLTVIENFTQFVLDDLPEGDPRRSDLLEVRTAAERAAALTRQLLAFSRKQRLEPECLDVNEVIRGIHKMLRRLIGEHVEIVLDLDADIGSVVADRGSLEQVLMNLVVNARDAMPDGGRITVSTGPAVLGTEDVFHLHGGTAGPCVRLTVADVGRGMDEATLSRIFEPFFTTKPVGKGTGLGLSTVYGIVQQNGGVIRVRSAPGAGSTFEVLLPVASASAAAVSPPAPEAAAPGPRRETILVVDDESKVAEAATRALGGAGYTVLSAIGGAEAIRLAAQYAGQIDLLLTDVVMPGFGGREVASRVRVVYPEIRVLYMSGYTDDVTGTFRADADGARLLDKPFSSEQLVRVVDELLGYTPRRE